MEPTELSTTMQRRSQNFGKVATVAAVWKPFVPGWTDFYLYSLKESRFPLLGINYSSQQTCVVLKIGEILQFSWGIFGHLTHLDQSRESKDIIRLFKPIWCTLFLFLFRRCGLTFSDLWPFCLPTLLYMWVWWHLRVYTMFEWWKKGVWLRWKDLQRLLWASKGRMRKQHHFEDDQERFMSRYISVFAFLQSASYHF